jgi:hypothetical protein
LTKFNPSDPVARQTWSKGDFAGQSAELPTSVFGHTLLKTSSSLELVGIDQNAVFTVNYPNNEGAGG